MQDLDLLKCWYGFIYTHNLSKFVLEETMKPKLEGLEVIYPENDGESVEIAISAGDEHLIILRRFSNNCKYSTSYMTHKRRFTEDEMKELAKNLD